MAFGSEYAYRADWPWLQRLYISIFGNVDLPGRIRARAVLWALRRIPCDHVLDVGAGTGVYALYLTREACCRVVALDADASRIKMIKRIADRLWRNNLSTVCASENAFPAMPAEDFSVVLAVEVLQYFPNLGQALLELQKRLRPGGVLVAHVPIRESLLAQEHILFNDTALRELLSKAGFESPEIRKTFNPFTQALCNIFSWCVPRHAMMAVVYPLLLLANVLTPRFTQHGSYRLVIARKPLFWSGNIDLMKGISRCIE